MLLENGRIAAQGLPFDLVAKGAFGIADDALINAVSTANSAANSKAPSRIPSRVQISDIVEEQEGAAKVDALTDEEERGS